MCRHADLKPGAVLSDRTTRKLYEVVDAQPRTTKLVDVASPVDDPRGVEFLTVNAISRLELVRPAPSFDGIASPEEFGPLG